MPVGIGLGYSKSGYLGASILSPIVLPIDYSSTGGQILRYLAQECVTGQWGSMLLACPPPMYISK